MDRLKQLGFERVENLGERRGKTVVRAYHPAHGWMYEKIDVSDDAELEAWAAKANVPVQAVSEMRIGAVKK